jgi:acyl-CoA synthetase (NDP forming)
MTMDQLFRPASVAVIGASNDTAKFGGRIAFNVAQSDVKQIFFISRAGGELHGRKVYRSLSDLPVKPDLVLLAVAADAAIENLREAAEMGTKAAVIFASGFAEADADGRGLQQQLVELAQRQQISLLGPNCIGFADFAARRFLGSGQGLTTATVGNTALITQSGSLGLALASRNRHRLRYLIATGNEAVLTAADVMLHLLRTDPEVQTYALILEGIRERERLTEAVELARERGKKVILLKPSGSEAGNRIAALHTGAISGSRDPLEAYCRQHGIRLTDTLRQFTGALHLLATNYSGGRRLGVFTTSGGSAVLTAGLGPKLGLQMPDLPAAARPAIAEQMGTIPDRVTNPFDTTGIHAMNPQRFGAALRSFMETGEFDLVLVPLGGSAGENAVARAKALKEIAARSTVPLVAVWQHQEQLEAQAFRDLYDSNVTLFTDLETPIEAMSLLADSSETQRVEHGPLSSRTQLPPRAAFDLLRSHGVRTAPFRTLLSPEDAGKAVGILGGPIALKVSHPALLHKSDKGMVVFPVSSASAAAAEFRKLEERIQDQDLHGAEIVAQSGISDGVEILCGFNRDSEVGAYMVLAAGGVFTEILQDTALAVLEPTESLRARIEETLRQLRHWPVLIGYREKPAYDWKAVVDEIMRLCELFLRATWIEAMEVNPLFALPEQGGAVVVDARILTSERPACEDAARLDSKVGDAGNEPNGRIEENR